LANRRRSEQTRFYLHQAKTPLSKLIELVETGGELVIARAGKPVASADKEGRGQARNC